LAKAEDDIEVRYAQASLGVADAELSQSEDINRRSPGTVSVAELRRLKLTRERAALQIDRSQLDVKVANLTAEVEKTAVAAAEDSIERRQIVAPFEGLVLDLLSHEAEWVNAGEPVLRMVRLDRLRVEGFFHMHQYNPEEMVHRPVTVELERARGEIVRLPGKVVFISPVVQAGDTYRVRAEVKNRIQENYWLLGPGMTAAMTIHIHDPPAAATADAAVPPSTK
jgi:macrolide-specific efflux system membrane fusion protein